MAVSVPTGGLTAGWQQPSSITLCFVHELSDFLNYYQFIINVNAYRLMRRHQGSRAV